MEFRLSPVPYHEVKAWLWAIPVLLISATLIGTTVTYSWRQPYDGLGWSSVSGKVVSVDSNGPAARAGLQVGDVIRMIDGTFIVEAFPLYAGKRAGASVTLSVLRQGKQLLAEMILQPTPPPLLIRRLEPALIAIGLWLFGVIVLVLRPASREAHLFFMINQVGSTVLAAGLLSAFGPEIAGRLFSTLLCWLSALIVHFHSTFPVLWSNSRRSILLRFFYGMALVLSLPYALSRLPALKLSPDYLVLYNGVRLYFALGLLAGMILLVRSYLTTTSQVARQRIRLVVFGTALALTPLVTLSILPEALQGRPMVPYDVTFVFLFMIPLSYGYAIYRHNLFQTDRILNHSLVYLSLALLWAGFYLTLVTGLNRAFPTDKPYNPLIGALLILIMTWTLPVLQEKVRGLVDHFFYGGWYDYRAVIGRFSQALNATLEEATLAELLVEQLPATLRIRGAALLMPVGNRRFLPICYKNAQVHPCDTPGRCLACQISGGVRMDGALAQFLRRKKRPMEAFRLRQALAGQNTDDAASLLACGEIQVWLPLVFQDELEGILLLGAKMADDLYSGEDYRILETLAWQTATTARNVRLVGELRRRLEEIVQSKQELQEAHRRLLTGREEERKRLAREIHDGPVQELVEISYRLRDCGRQAGGSSLEGSLKELREASLHLLEDLRRICTELRPPGIDILGLAACIRAYASEEVKAGPLIVLDLDEEGRLPKDVSISLFRIYQEAIANVIRHSAATRVTVRLEVSSDSCTLTIQDNGRGFAVPSKLEALAREGHFGLLGIQEQAESLRGRLEVVSTSDVGTRVRVWVPLNVTT